MHVTKSITVARARNEVYAFWRDFENLPRFMHHLESVENIGGGRSHWCAKGIAGKEREWDAVLVEDRPNERISWRTVDSDSDVKHTGTVAFLSAGDNATEVQVALEDDAPGGKPGAMIARLVGEEPGQQIEEDLVRFKRVLETGDIERPYQRASDVVDSGFRRREPVEPVNRETDPEARF